MAFQPPPPFQPVIMFQPESLADELAIKQVYALQSEVFATMDTERNRQTQIGISEIGDDCQKCVARKLSGLYENPPMDGGGWKAQVGTFIHGGLENHWPERYPERYIRVGDKYEVRPGLVATDEQPLIHLERRLQVHQHKTLDLGGSCDMFIQGASFGIVNDWKTKSQARLKASASGKLDGAYRVQPHTYGFGWEQQGFLVTHVMLYGLPRDGHLNEAKPILMRYDRQIAIDALAKIDNLIDAAEILERAYPGQGWEKLIAAQEKASGCWDCKGYEEGESKSFFSEMFG